MAKEYKTDENYMTWKEFKSLPVEQRYAPTNCWDLEEIEEIGDEILEKFPHVKPESLLYNNFDKFDIPLSGFYSVDLELLECLANQSADELEVFVDLGRVTIWWD